MRKGLAGAKPRAWAHRCAGDGWHGRAGELGRQPEERLRISEGGARVFVLEGSLAADRRADQRRSWPESLEACARRPVPGLLRPRAGVPTAVAGSKARRGLRAAAREQPCHACPGLGGRAPSLVPGGPRARRSPAPALPVPGDLGCLCPGRPMTHPLSDAHNQVISYFSMVFFFTFKQSPSFRTAPCFPSPHTPGRQSLSCIVISIYTVWGGFLQRVLFCF